MPNGRSRFNRTRINRSQRSNQFLPMFKLAHLSDVHLPPLPRPRFSELLGKRLIGLASWQFRRRAIHCASVLQAVRNDIISHNPDHVAFTGDLINIALPGEFKNGARWLSGLGAGGRITFVPGNHDAYVKFPWQNGMGLWAHYMTGDLQMAGPRGAGGLASPFPFVRQRRNFALIGVSSGVPAPWNKATGELGNRQLQALKIILADLRQRGFCRIVLIHHPPLPGQAIARKALLDAPQLGDILAAEGAEFVLHGHNHEHMHKQLTCTTGIAHVLGVPSASARQTRKKPAAAWYLHHLTRRDGRWLSDVTVRAFDPASKTMVTRTQFSLDTRLQPPQSQNLP